MNKLNQQKSQKKTTVPKSPDFVKQKTKPLTREYVNEGQPTIKPKAIGGAPSTGMKSQMSGGAPASVGGSVMAKSKMSQSSQKQPATTKANELYQKRRREEMEAKAA